MTNLKLNENFNDIVYNVCKFGQLQFQYVCQIKDIFKPGFRDSFRIRICYKKDGKVYSFSMQEWRSEIADYEDGLARPSTWSEFPKMCKAWYKKFGRQFEQSL